MFECPDCDGKISRYHAAIRVCRNCRKIINSDDLLKLLKDVGLQKQTIDIVQAEIVVHEQLL